MPHTSPHSCFKDKQKQMTEGSEHPMGLKQSFPVGNPLDDCSHFPVGTHYKPLGINKLCKNRIYMDFIIAIIDAAFS